MGDEMRLERITSDTGLSCLSYTPDGSRANLPAVVLTHGLTASKTSLDLLASNLCSRGYRCLTYDVRGHKLGSSLGPLLSVVQAIQDLSEMVELALRLFGCESVVLMGHSMGGLLSLTFALDAEVVAGVVCVACAQYPSRGFGSVVGIAMLRQRGDYIDGADPKTLLAQLDELRLHSPMERACPRLFVAAKGDVLVKPTQVRALAQLAGPNSEYAEVDGSHLEAPDRARGMVANWMDRTFKHAGE